MLVEDLRSPVGGASAAAIGGAQRWENQSSRAVFTVVCYSLDIRLLG